ncbi:GNAT family N-acetyltransferase [Stackebrandtia soli]|uniref:GNAT family N-acetyltransferase n=1 Tax=Stackebrandtia soli TaxID=1892856 RepID=UPI0039E9D6CD
MRLTELSRERREQWESGWRERPGWREPARRGVFVEWKAWGVEVDGRDVGTVAVGFSPSDLPMGVFIDDIHIEPNERGRGYGRAARELVTRWALEREATQIRVMTEPTNEALTRLFADYDVASRHKRLTVRAEDGGPDDAIAPMTPKEYPRWLGLMIDDFATSLATRDGVSMDQALAQADELIKVMLPDEAATSGNELWTLAVDGEPAAYLWLHPRPDVDEVYVQDVVVEEKLRGRGLGRRVMRRAATSALTLGLSSVRLHVFAHNTTANALYDRMGYRTVTEYRSASLT